MLMISMRRNRGSSRVWYNEKSDAICLLASPGYVYDIDMSRCRTAAEVLDWIHQINDKNWGRELMVQFLDVLFAVIPSDLWAGKA